MRERNEEIIRSGFQKLEQMGCKIHRFKDGDYQIPTKYDLSFLPRNYMKGVTRELRVLEDYIKMPAIEDWFVLHSERVAWLNGLDQEAKSAAQHNRLTGNEINIIFLVLMNLSEKCFKSNPDLKVSILNLQEKLEDELPENGPQRKFTPQYADRVSEVALTVLKMFEKKS